MNNQELKLFHQVTAHDHSYLIPIFNSGQWIFHASFIYVSVLSLGIKVKKQFSNAFKPQFVYCYYASFVSHSTFIIQLIPNEVKLTKWIKWNKIVYIL